MVPSHSFDFFLVMDKARENRARRAAERQGFTVRKSRTRDPLAIAYGWHILRGRREVAHLRDIGELERWLADRASRSGGGKITMRYSIHVWCPYGAECPKLHRADKSWNPRHGSAGFACRIPASTGTRALKRFGYKSKSDAEEAAKHVGRLLDLGPDEATRCKIGDLVAAVKRDTPYPPVETVRLRLGLGLDPGSAGITTGEWLVR